MRKQVQRVAVILSCTVLLCFTQGVCQQTDEDLLESGHAGSVNEPASQLRGAGVNDRNLTDKHIQDSKGKSAQNTDAAEAAREEDREKFLDELAGEIAGEISDDIRLQVKKELKDEITKEARLGGWARSVPPWVNNITFGGDIRLRYQAEYFDPDNDTLVLDPNDTSSLLNTTKDRKRMRARVRLNFKVKVTDRMDAGIRISTGSTTDPVSTAITFGDYMNKDSVALDLAYVRFKPMPEMTLWAGRMPNPWFCTDLVWDSDLNFEGIALNFDTKLMRHARGFVTAGIFPIQEEEWTGNDKWLYGCQAGFVLSYTPSLRYKPVISFKVAGAYYDYKHITGEVNDPSYPGETDWTAPEFKQTGNTVFNINPLASTLSEYVLALASDYDEVNVTASLDLGFFDPVHVVLSGDYVKNIGFDRDKVALKLDRDPWDVREDVVGYQYGISVGYPKVRELGTWKVSFNMKRLESDAVIDAFTDSNFNGGGTNAKGKIVGIELGLARNVWLSTRWMSSDCIYDVPQFGKDLLLVDLNVVF